MQTNYIIKTIQNINQIKCSHTIKLIECLIGDCRKFYRRYKHLVRSNDRITLHFAIKPQNKHCQSETYMFQMEKKNQKHERYTLYDKIQIK